MRIAVIGAGPAGITAAYELAKGGAEVHVYEASESIGGLLCCSICGASVSISARIVSSPTISA